MDADPHSIERPRKIVVRPEDGMMWVAVGPDGSVMPIPQQSTGLPDDPMAGITRAVHESYSPDWRVETAPLQQVEGLPPGKIPKWRAGLVIDNDVAALAEYRATLARERLDETDFVVTKAVEDGRSLSADWRAWRTMLRGIANGSGAELPSEPVRYTP